MATISYRGQSLVGLMITKGSHGLGFRVQDLGSFRKQGTLI